MFFFHCALCGYLMMRKSLQWNNNNNTGLLQKGNTSVLRSPGLRVWQFYCWRRSESESELEVYSLTSCSAWHCPSAPACSSILMVKMLVVCVLSSSSLSSSPSLKSVMLTSSCSLAAGRAIPDVTSLGRTLKRWFWKNLMIVCRGRSSWAERVWTASSSGYGPTSCTKLCRIPSASKEIRAPVRPLAWRDSSSASAGAAVEGWRGGRRGPVCCWGWDCWETRGCDGWGSANAGWSWAVGGGWAWGWNQT